MSLIFDLLRKNFLVYNTSWEDPAIDRKLLSLDEDSRIVMLSSAGDNALCYLLDRPGIIHCVDSNPRQNALLELKKLCFKELEFEDLFQLFGRGFYTESLKYDLEYLLQHLHQPYRAYWKKHLKLFSPSGRGSFYFRATTGWFAWILNRYIDHKNLRNRVNRLLEADSLNRQKEIYQYIEPVLFNGSFIKVIERSGMMRLLGVPENQVNLLPGTSLTGYLKKVLNHVFTRMPIGDNYFWRVYLEGNYTKSCCPDYLKQENFEVIKEQIHKIKTYNTGLHQFLINHSETNTHFVLLDHMDWYRSREENLLDELWRQILANAVPGSKILFRSAGTSCTFLPGFALDKLRFEQEKTARLHAQDRVGTYGSTCLGIVDHV